MGSVIYSRSDYLEFLAEVVGYKSGVLLSQEELLSFLSGMPEYQDLGDYPSGATLRLRSEFIQDTIARILNRLGNADAKGYTPLGVTVLKKYMHDESELELLFSVGDVISKMIGPAIEDAKRKGQTNIDATPILDAVKKKYGLKGMRMATETMLDQLDFLHQFPWSRYRRVEWENTVELKELFESESLETQYGSFLDQRYIDYLHANFDQIDNMNWRKFEGLTAEYFEREGFHCKVGRGRGDGGIDIRVWPEEADRTKPPLILIQCKRQRSKVKVEVVKALWADIEQEKAESGLIVTTSQLAPGAEFTRKARSYPINTAERETLRMWIENMRTGSSMADVKSKGAKQKGRSPRTS